MTAIDPTPYAAVYVVVVFLPPWVTFAWLVWRELRFARSHGIVVTAQNWRTEWPRLKQFRRQNPEASRLYGLARKWLGITIVAWIIGFVALGGALFLLDRAGILVGPNNRSRESRLWSNFPVEQPARSHALAAADYRRRSAADALSCIGETFLRRRAP